MGLVSLYVDGTEGTCRAKVLTGSATDATLFVYHRELRGIWHFGCRRHHLYSSRRTVAGTVAALHPVGVHHAILIHEHGMADLHGRFSATVNGRMAPAGQTSEHFTHSGRQ